MLGRCQLEKTNWKKVNGSTGEAIFETQDLDEKKLKQDLIELKSLGIKSLAVVLMHSYT